MMLVWIWTRDDETGLLDDEFRDGDIDHVAPDGTPLGGLEVKAYLIANVPDPPNFQKFVTATQTPEYKPGPSAESNEVRRKRIYRVDWRSKFSASEVELIEDGNATLPDGPTSGGGTVAGGVVSGLFTVQDFIRK